MTDPQPSTVSTVELTELLGPYTTELDPLRQQFAAAYGSVQTAQATLEKFAKAAEAAEAEAKAISVHIRAVYKTGGRTKDAVKLKAQQREAFENAEILRSLQDEGQVALARAEYETHRAAISLKGCREVSYRKLEEQLAEHLSEHLPPEAWLYLDLVAFRAERGWNDHYNARPDFDNSTEFAQREFALLLARAARSREAQTPVSDLLPLPPGVGSYGQSPVQMERLRQEIERQEAALGEGQ